MSSGAKIVMLVAREQSPGVLPADPQWWVESRVSDGLSEEVSTEESATVVDSRYSQGGIPVSAEVTGSLEVELRVGSFDDWFEGVAFNRFEGDTLVCGGDTRQTYQIIKWYRDVGIAYRFAGIHVDTAEIDISTEALITATFGLAGSREPVRITDANTVVAPIHAAARKPTVSKLVSARNVGGVVINGVNLNNNACLQAINIQFANNLEAVPCIGSEELVAQKQIEKKFNCTVTATLAFSPTAADIAENVKTRDTVSLEFYIRDADTNQYKFTFDTLEVNTAGIPDGGGDDLINQELEFAQVRKPCRITRTLVTDIFPTPDE